MDQALLVGPDISGGRRLLEALGDPLRIEAAFWWFEDDSWRLVLATPLVDEQGPRSVYSSVLDYVESTKEVSRELFDRTQVVSPSEGIVTALDIGGEGQVPLNRLILNASVRSAYVTGAYFYKFDPKTFAKAS